MEREELKNKILDVAENAPLASVSTLADEAPKVRYMMMRMCEDLSLCSPTFLHSRKVEQIKANNSVQVLMGGDEKDMNNPYITVSGRAGVVTDRGSKEKYWRDELSAYFSGKEDPNFAVFIVVPDVIEYMEAGAREPEIYDARQSKQKKVKILD